MSREESKSYLRIMRRRYRAMLTKKARGKVLDDYCATTGKSRKHAIRLLNNRAKPSGRPRGRPPGGTEAGTALLAKAWKVADMPCGKLLEAALPDIVGSLLRRGEAEPAAAAEVLAMSSATIDRRLRSRKAAARGRGRRRSASLSVHRREIPLKIETWPAASPKEPGWVEVDTVAHCGGSMRESFVWTLTMTDVGTGWTRLRAVWNKGSEGISRELRAFVDEAPFVTRAMNSDNGAEFVNGVLRHDFSAYAPQVLRTRSRSYRKNDNAHVEQKNGAMVRGLIGYGRIDVREAVPLMNEIYALHELFANLYVPTMRLESKTRDGRRYMKKFEKDPKTPARRVLESPSVPAERKEQVVRLLAGTDVVALKLALDKKLRRLAVLLAEDKPSSPPPSPADALRAAPSGSPPRGTAAGKKTTGARACLRATRSVS